MDNWNHVLKRNNLYENLPPVDELLLFYVGGGSRSLYFVGNMQDDYIIYPLYAAGKKNRYEANNNVWWQPLPASPII